MQTSSPGSLMSRHGRRACRMDLHDSIPIRAIGNVGIGGSAIVVRRTAGLQLTIGPTFFGRFSTRLLRAIRRLALMSACLRY